MQWIKYAICIPMRYSIWCERLCISLCMDDQHIPWHIVHRHTGDRRSSTSWFKALLLCAETIGCVQLCRIVFEQRSDSLLLHFQFQFSNIFSEIRRANDLVDSASYPYSVFIRTEWPHPKTSSFNISYSAISCWLSWLPANFSANISVQRHRETIA